MNSRILTLIVALTSFSCASFAESGRPYMSLRGTIHILWGFSIKANLTISSEDPLTGSFTYRMDHKVGSGVVKCGSPTILPDYREYTCETQTLNRESEQLEDLGIFIVRRTAQDSFYLFKLKDRSESLAVKADPTASFELNLE